MPDSQGVKVLTNHRYGYRLRAGRYRVLFDYDGEVRIVEIQEVKKRDEPFSYSESSPPAPHQTAAVVSGQSLYQFSDIRHIGEMSEIE